MNDAEQVDELQISWPSGKIQTAFDLSANQTFNAKEDGEITSELLKVKETDVNATPSFRLLGNYPNPFLGKTTIQIEVPSSGLIDFKVYDLYGKKLQSKTVSADGEGIIEFELYLPTLSKQGVIYLIRFGDKTLFGKALQIGGS